MYYYGVRDSNITLQLKQVRSLGVDVWSLCLEHLVETLALETTVGHSKVDKCHPGAQIRWKLNLKEFWSGRGRGKEGRGREKSGGGSEERRKS